MSKNSAGDGSSRRSVTFYGHFSGWSSYPTTCKAIAKFLLKELPKVGADLSLVNLRKEPCDDPVLADVSWRVSTGSVAYLFGFPEHWADVPRSMHSRLVGCHVGDVDQIPPAWVAAMSSLDLVLTQSAWCAWVFKKCGVTKPIAIVRAGVDPCMRPGGWSAEIRRPLRVVHFCSSPGARKGTAEVLEGFAQSCRRGDAVLEVHASAPGWRQRVIEAGQRFLQEGGPEIRLAPDHGPMPPRDMAALYRGYDLVLQPSRGEGLGLVPVEGLSCGVPAVATLCTGFAETLSSDMLGLVPVPTGPLSFCTPFGNAPGLKAEDIASSLRTAYSRYAQLLHEARANAETVRSFWEWDSVLARDGLVSLLLAR